MPYIKYELRNKETKYNPKDAGQLNWAITDDIKDKDNAIGVAHYVGIKIYNTIKFKEKPNYQFYNDCMGVAVCCYLEWFRRKKNIIIEIRKDTGIVSILLSYLTKAYDEYVAPYEDEKIQINGDVY